MVSPLMEPIAGMVRTEPRGGCIPYAARRRVWCRNGEPLMAADVPGSP